MQPSCPSPVWPPPKAPIHPQRLAKLANALGLPIPAVRTPLNSESGTHPTRFPTSSGSTLVPSTSKYLLHVIPPSRLLHVSTEPPPPPANGYHAQFSRGVLVPVFANFHTQLAAIAKEYALPSIIGITLYLVSSSEGTMPYDEPGPRLTEEIWKHIWTRIVKAERLESNVLLQSPPLYRLGGSESAPSLPQNNSDSAPQLRPLPSAGILQHTSPVSPFTPSSSASSISDLRTSSKSPPPSAPDTPDTSQASIADVVAKANALVLPGLESSSLIPVLAKVEFDIDSRKAGWYEPWLRNRRVNHAKRARGRAGRQASVTEGEEAHENRPPLALLTGTKNAAIPDSADYPKFDSLQIQEEGVRELSKTRPQLSVMTSSQEHLRDVLYDVNESNDDLDGFDRVRSPAESEKRVGAIFGELDLGLDPTEDYNDNVPYDKRRSHLIMKAKLDEIERTMLHLSPRALKLSIEDDSIMNQRSPSNSVHLAPSPTRISGFRNGQPYRRDDSLTRQISGPAPPGMPHAYLKESVSSPPPPFAVNGTVPPPDPFLASSKIPNAELSSQSLHHRLELENGLPPDIVIQAEESSFTDYPIPLSPDPFGRFPSSMEASRAQFSGANEEFIYPHPGSHHRRTDANQGRVASRARPSTTATVTSRFSVDYGDEAVAKTSNRATLMSVKGIKKLWRRSDKSSQSSIQFPPMPSAGGTSPNQLPHGGSIKGERGLPPSHLDGLHLDQESARSSFVHYSPQPTPPPIPAPSAPEPEKPVRKSILKWATKPRNGSISHITAGPRTSPDQSRPPSRANGIADGLRSRQSSVGGLGHVSMLSTDIPPSPRIPEQFLVDPRQAAPLPTVFSTPPLALPGKRQSPSKSEPPRSPVDSQAAPSPTVFSTLPLALPGKRQSASKSEPPRSPVDSQANSDLHLPSSTTRSSSPSRRSTTSSRESQCTRPSFDVSQFEIVSPKASALS